MQIVTRSKPLIDVMLVLASEMARLDQYVATKVFPVLRVGKKDGHIPKILARRRVETVKRHKDGTFNRVETKLDEDTYSCEEAGLEERVSDEDRTLYRDSFDAELVAARAAVNSLLIARDNSLASTLFSTTTFGAGYNTAAVATWDNASGVPLKDVSLAQDKVAQRIGLWPNKLLIGRGLWTKLSQNAQIIDKVKAFASYAGSVQLEGRIPLTLLATAFNVEEVIVGMGVKDTANEGATESLSDIWTNTYALPFYTSPNLEANPGDVALGRTFVWDQVLSEAEAQGIEADQLMAWLVDMYREESTTADIVRAREYVTMKMLNKGAAHLITGC